MKLTLLNNAMKIIATLLEGLQRLKPRHPSFSRFKQFDGLTRRYLPMQWIPIVPMASRLLSHAADPIPP